MIRGGDKRVSFQGTPLFRVNDDQLRDVEKRAENRITDDMDDGHHMGHIELDGNDVARVEWYDE